jgi:RimJ/RimL family protein N-acetyltransferase
MIYGKRLRLRATERSDLENFVRWLNDPEVSRGINLYRPMSLAEEENWFEKTLQAPGDERPMVIEIAQGDGSWLPIGNLGVGPINWRDRSAELGIMIGEKSYWDQGFGREAILLLLSHCFQVLNLNRVYLRVKEDNPRAIRAYEKIGFVYEGRMRQADYHDGRYFDILLMSVLHSEWKSQE